MNNIRVLIEFLPSTQGSIDYQKTVLPVPHEISNPVSLNTIHAGGIKPFILGSSKLGTPEQGGDGHYFWGKQDEWRDGRQIGGQVEWFISQQRADNNGNLNPPFQFPLYGADIDHFSIYFDNVVRQWATVINVDGVDYANNDAHFIWIGTAANLHTIQIKKWNTPNFQIRILGGPLTGLINEYGRSQIKKLTAGSRNTFDNSKPSFGIISQPGSMGLIDTDDNLLELNQLGLLKAQLPVNAYFNAPDRLSNESVNEYMERINDYMLGSYLTDEFQYSFNSTDVSVDFNDNILNWSNVFFGGIGNKDTNTAETFFNALVAVTPDKVNIDEETRAYFGQINIPDGFMTSGNLTDAWNIFCEATLTVILKNIKGEIWIKQ